MPEKEPLVKFDSFGQGDFCHSWRFSGFKETLQAMELSEIIPLLARVEKYAADGFHAAGFISYEAASGMNRDLATKMPVEGLPLAWFAIYKDRTEAEPGGPTCLAEPAPSLEPDTDPENYASNVERIREYIACGDSYQVNYTFRMNNDFKDDPMELYRTISGRQFAPFCAYLDTGRFAVISASPELFFSLKEGLIRTRPMKGTARRGRWLNEDEEQIKALKGSAKERAENLMIVDLLRNDLGVVAKTGSVKVDSLFDIETYPTLHQMTSTVSAQVREGIGLANILAALFPCGSVTGAPKRRSMELIKELEKAPRGVYCGAIGYVAPGGEALFSVAIRTLLFDKETQRISLGIGSGITTDSVPEKEYQECLLKARFLNSGVEEFSLIESLRVENGEYPLLARHLERLRSSASYFGFRFDGAIISNALERYAEGKIGVCKVRLLLAKDGEINLSSGLLASGENILRLAISSRRVDSNDPFRYHKTTCRELLDKGRMERSDVDEILFLNERGELTEGSYHNLLLKIDGQMLTPKLDSGLLPGVLREELLERGEVAEALLYPEDILKAEEIWLINAVRGKRRAVFVEAVDGEVS